MADSEAVDVWEDFASGPGMQHQTFEGDEGLLRELSILGWLRFHKAFDHALDPDRHPGEFEIHYIVRGELNWWVGKTAYKLSSGMALVIKPDELHGSKTGVLEPCEHFWLRLAFPQSSGLPGITGRQSTALQKDLHALTSRAFPASHEVREAFASLLDEHREPVEYSPLVCRASLHLLLASLIRDHRTYFERKDSVMPKISSPIEKSLAAIHENLEDPPSVEALAELSFMSESSFRKRFRDEVGGSPHDYIIQRRVEEAKRLLRQRDKSIIDIALDLGFSSSQYFATVFKRKTGVSPKQFREQG